MSVCVFVCRARWPGNFEEVKGMWGLKTGYGGRMRERPIALEIIKTNFNINMKSNIQS